MSVSESLNQSPSQAPCRECGRWLKVRKDGRIPMHKAASGRRTFAVEWCNGSALRPSWRRALIGCTATIIGYSTEGDIGTDSVAHICLDIDGGPRVFLQADDPKGKWRIEEYNR